MRLPHLRSDLLDHFNLQILLGHNPLEPRVRLLERTQTSDLVRSHRAEALVLRVDRLFIHPVRLRNPDSRRLVRCARNETLCACVS